MFAITSIQETIFPLPASRFPLPASRFPLPASRFPLPASRFPTPALGWQGICYTAALDQPGRTARFPPLKHSRIFHLAATGAGADVNLHAAPVGANQDETHEQLGGLFRSAFHTHARRQFGHFDSEQQSAPFCRGVSAYRDGETDAQSLGQQLADQFRECLQAIEQPLSWYLWFIIEAHGENEILYVFLFDHEESHHISAQLIAGTVRSINPARLQYAIKIDMAEWRAANSTTYLSYLSPRQQQPVAQAWRNFIGFAEGVDRAAQTEQFLGIIERYADALPAGEEHEYRARVVDYCLDRDRLGEPVELEALSRHVDEAEPEALMRFVSERAEEPVRTLYPDRGRLRRYVRFYGRDQDMSISFSTATLGRHIVYDEAGGTLVIREIPKALKAQLAQYTRRADD